MNKAVSYLCLARKAGLLETGEDNTRQAVKSGRARLVALSSDASPNARQRAEGFVAATHVPLACLPLAKEELSQATGRPGCSMAVFLDTGLAAGFLRELAVLYGGEYEELAALLAKRAEKAKRRRKAAMAQGDGKHGKRRSKV